MSVGTPNIPPAPHIRDALCRAAADAKNYIYAINDQTALLDAVAAWYDRRYGVKLDPQTEICSLLGSQEGLAHIALSIVDEGDTVLVPDPCYPVFGDGAADGRGHARLYAPAQGERLCHRPGRDPRGCGPGRAH